MATYRRNDIKYCIYQAFNWVIGVSVGTIGLKVLLTSTIFTQLEHLVLLSYLEHWELCCNRPITVEYYSRLLIRQGFLNTNITKYTDYSYKNNELLRWSWNQAWYSCSLFHLKNNYYAIAELVIQSTIHKTAKSVHIINFIIV